MITVEAINDRSKVRGTSLSGYLNTSYATLVELLGEPNAPVDGYKTDAEWHVKVKEEGDAPAYATIYNFKDGNGRWICNYGCCVPYSGLGILLSESAICDSKFAICALAFRGRVSDLRLR